MPFGLTGVKMTLDGDRDTHNQMRPLRGGQGTFDRIVENIRRWAGAQHRDRRELRRDLRRTAIRRLLEFLRQQDFADKLVKVNFKPVIRKATEPAPPQGMLPLTPVARAASRSAARA